MPRRAIYVRVDVEATYDYVHTHEQFEAGDVELKDLPVNDPSVIVWIDQAYQHGWLRSESSHVPSLTDIVLIVNDRGELASAFHVSPTLALYTFIAFTKDG